MEPDQENMLELLIAKAGGATGGWDNHEMLAYGVAAGAQAAGREQVTLREVAEVACDYTSMGVEIYQILYALDPEQTYRLLLRIGHRAQKHLNKMTGNPGTLHVEAGIMPDIGHLSTGAASALGGHYLESAHGIWPTGT